jgi:hypothetical protein
MKKWDNIFFIFMNKEHIVKELNRNKVVFDELLSDLPDDFILWKQNPKKWCLLEIVCHLYDEEREDFRLRIKHILENPELPLKSINPVGWVSERKYLNQNYHNILNNFLDERIKSIGWLIGLGSLNWNNVYKHPKLGEITAKMIFANWLAHDYLHLRQIVRLKYDYLKSITGENLSYAGDW